MEVEIPAWKPSTRYRSEGTTKYHHWSLLPFTGRNCRSSPLSAKSELIGAEPLIKCGIPTIPGILYACDPMTKIIFIPILNFIRSRQNAGIKSLERASRGKENQRRHSGCDLLYRHRVDTAPGVSWKCIDLLYLLAVEPGWAVFKNIPWNQGNFRCRPHFTRGYA